jgi:2-dehydro-3-deoxygluconokinase
MKVLTIGEIMMRLQPQNYQRFMQAKSFDCCYGGGEANVAVSLSQMGVDTAFCTKLPQNELANACIKELRGWGVDTSFIARGGNRMGIYFCEKGASQRPSKVIYDRANSSMTTINKNDIDIDKMLLGVDWIHFTGITPALGESVIEFLDAVLPYAKAKGIKVSCDLNYRNKLWTKSEANKVMTHFMQFVDVLISNEEDCKDVFGIEASASDINSGKLSSNAYANVAERVSKEYGIETVSFTLRESLSASSNNWSGILYNNGKIYESKKYNLTIVDRVGGGDSFGAGLIYSLLNNFDKQSAIEYAVAGSALKHSIEGDFNIATVDEIKKLAEGDGSGRVQR